MKYLLLVLLALPASARAGDSENTPVDPSANELLEPAGWQRPQNGCVSNLGLEDRWCQQFDEDQCAQHYVRCHWR